MMEGFEARLEARLKALEEFIHERCRRTDAKLDRIERRLDRADAG